MALSRSRHVRTIASTSGAITYLDAAGAGRCEKAASRVLPFAANGAKRLSHVMAPSATTIATMGPTLSAPMANQLHQKPARPNQDTHKLCAVRRKRENQECFLQPAEGVEHPRRYDATPRSRWQKRTSQASEGKSAGRRYYRDAAGQSITHHAAIYRAKPGREGAITVCCKRSVPPEPFDS
jgi:hypothetical protein